MTHRPFAALALCVLAATLTAQAPGSAEPVDLDVVHRIRQEAMQNSKVMDHLFQLTDVVGHRLTNSPGYFVAANWVEKQLKDWGLEAHQEKWGPYGRGWDFTHFSAEMIEPSHATLIGVPLAWTPGTNGKVTGEAMVASLQNDADLDKYKGKLAGKIVLLGTGRDLSPPTTAASSRFTDQELQQVAAAAPAGRGGRGVPGTAALNAGRGGNPVNAPPPNANQSFANRLNKFLLDEGVLVAVRIGNSPSEAGTVFAQGGGSRNISDPVPSPMVALTPEHYNRILRLLDAKIPVKLEFEISTQFFDDRTDSVNVIGEIRGNKKPDEVV